jgi:hypothetical protein
MPSLPVASEPESPLPARQVTPPTTTSSSCWVKPWLTPSLRVTIQQRASVVTPESGFACREKEMVSIVWPLIAFRDTLGLTHIIAIRDIPPH